MPTKGCLIAPFAGRIIFRVETKFDSGDRMAKL